MTTTQEHKEQKLKELADLPIEEEFEIPDGLIIPFGQKVLIRRVAQKERYSPGGILMLGDGDTKRSLHDIVVAIGPTVDLESCPIKLGMKVEFGIGLEDDTVHQGISYLCIDQFHIKGAVPEGNYKHPYYPTNRDKRRAVMIENTERAAKITDAKLDEIQNG